jgi:hypothetical protein
VVYLLTVYASSATRAAKTAFVVIIFYPVNGCGSSYMTTEERRRAMEVLFLLEASHTCCSLLWSTGSQKRM